MPQSDSDDEFPDDIGQLDLSNVPGLQEISVTNSIRTFNIASHPHPPAIPPPSHLLFTSSSPSEYDCDDEIDESTLAALDALEAAHHTPTLRDSPSTAQSLTPILQAPAVARKRELPSPQSLPASKKGKKKADNRIESSTTMLEGFETEINCPICFDIIVAAHICNPCGHSCCGECAQGWISHNKSSPTCAVCRAVLSKTKPLLPNYALDAVIHQYIRALSLNGRSEWQEKGASLADWKKRQDKWRRLAAINVAQAEAARVKENTRHRRRVNVHQASDPFATYMIRNHDDDDDEDGDPTYQEHRPVEVPLSRRILRRQRTSS